MQKRRKIVQKRKKNMKKRLDKSEFVYVIDGEHSAPLVKGERASERWRGDSRKLDMTIKGIPPPPYGGPPPFDKGGWCPVKLSALQTQIW